MTETTINPWRPMRFVRAMPGKPPVETWGYEQDGLALRHWGWATPRAETRWSLIHCGSGGTFLRMIGIASVVMPVASKIAACTDWTLFDLPNGWEQTDPELPAKVGAICLAHPEARPDTSFEADRMSDADARAVIQLREEVDARN